MHLIFVWGHWNSPNYGLEWPKFICLAIANEWDLQLYLGRDKLAMFSITVYVNIIVYMYLYTDAHAQVYFSLYDALTGVMERALCHRVLIRYNIHL